MKNCAHPLNKPVSNVIGLYQLGHRLKNLIYFNAEQLYEWVLFSKDHNLRSLLIQYHVERNYLATAIQSYLIEDAAITMAANDDHYMVTYISTPAYYQVQAGDSQVLELLLAQEHKFLSDVERMAHLLPEFPGDLLRNVDFSCKELIAELSVLEAEKANF